MKKKKYYAVHHLETKIDSVVSTWEECKELTYKKPTMYKSFSSEKEAEEWLSSITLQDEEKRRNYPREKKVYAVHYSDTDENFVVPSWKKCRRLIENKEACYAMFKSFVNPKDAFEWLNKIDLNQEERWFKIKKRNESSGQRYRKRMTFMKKNIALSELMKKEPLCVMISSQKIQDVFLEWSKDNGYLKR